MLLAKWKLTQKYTHVFTGDQKCQTILRSFGKIYTHFAETLKIENKHNPFIYQKSGLKRDHSFTRGCENATHFGGTSLITHVNWVPYPWIVHTAIRSLSIISKYCRYPKISPKVKKENGRRPHSRFNIYDHSIPVSCISCKQSCCPFSIGIATSGQPPRSVCTFWRWYLWSPKLLDSSICLGVIKNGIKQNVSNNSNSKHTLFCVVASACELRRGCIVQVALMHWRIYPPDQNQESKNSLS